MLNDVARPAAMLGWPKLTSFPHQHKNPALPEKPGLIHQKPRLIFELQNMTAEVWCISDLLEHLPDKASYQSSSEQKWNNLDAIFDGNPVDVAVAFGTAAHPGANSENGSVVVGTRVFLHDGHSKGNENPDSRWHGGPFDEVVNSSMTKEFFDQMVDIETNPSSVKERLLTPPLNPTFASQFHTNFDYVALSEINVSDYTEYDKKDLETIDAYSAKNDLAHAGSLETTHGLIRLKSKAPFIFVSGITDRVGYFDSEVNPRTYAQNMVAAHNAGVFVAWMLPKLDILLGQQAAR